MKVTLSLLFNGFDCGKYNTTEVHSHIYIHTFMEQKSCMLQIFLIKNCIDSNIEIARRI